MYIHTHIPPSPFSAFFHATSVFHLKRLQYIKGKEHTAKITWGFPFSGIFFLNLPYSTGPLHFFPFCNDINNNNNINRSLSNNNPYPLYSPLAKLLLPSIPYEFPWMLCNPSETSYASSHKIFPLLFLLNFLQFSQNFIFCSHLFNCGVVLCSGVWKCSAPAILFTQTKPHHHIVAASSTTLL